MEREEVNSGSIIDVKVLRRIFQIARPYRGYFYMLVLLTLLLGVLAPLKPLLVQYTLDHQVANHDYEGMVKMVALIIATLAAHALTQYAHVLISGRIGQYVIRDLRGKLYNHLMKFQLKFFDKTPVGRLVTRTVSDMEALADVFSEGLAALAGDLVLILSILIFMLAINWRLALVSLSTIPLMLLSTYIFKEKVKVAFNEVRNAVSNLNSFVQERLSGMAVAQIFGSEKREVEKFKKINEKHREAHLKSVFYYSVYFPVAEIISAVGIGMLVWYGSKQAIYPHTGITIGALTAFIMYVQMFFRPIRMIADRYNTLQMGIVSSARIISLLDNNENLTHEGTVELKNVKGKVELDHVWFAYKEGEYVLKNVTFSANPGEMIALVGATGAGKSSIANLLNRFYEIDRGEIRIDGVNIAHATISSLRRNIGLVMQDVFLFSNTIRYNISLGSTDVTDEMIMNAARLVGADTFIERMPGGLDYNVMERGATLSIGQRQLLSFIRAIVYDPKALILDEATSSIDHEGEKMIQRATEQMMRNRTAIVIAHRLATVRKADKIIVLEKGEIKEMGRHEALLSNANGYYAHFQKTQEGVR